MGGVTDLWENGLYYANGQPNGNFIGAVICFPLGISFGIVPIGTAVWDFCHDRPWFIGWKYLPGYAYFIYIVAVCLAAFGAYAPNSYSFGVGVGFILIATLIDTKDFVRIYDSWEVLRQFFSDSEVDDDPTRSHDNNPTPKRRRLLPTLQRLLDDPTCKGKAASYSENH